MTYSAAKHAAAAFAAACRMEWKSFGIEVCTVLPSFHKTPLLDGVYDKVDKLWQVTPPATKHQYTEAGHASLAMASEQLLTDWAWEADRVTDGLTRAVAWVTPPPAELTIGSDARYGLNVIRHFPPRVVETLIYYWLGWDFVEPE